MNLSFICKSQAQDSSLAILREWAVYAGNTDSTFQTPIVSDSNYTYVASVVSDSINGVDIVIHKYMTSGDIVWMQRWSGVGFGRDQSSAICIDRENIYLCGTTYSSANNFDYVIIKLAISTGAIDWVRTYNGSASNYDVATAIAVTDSEVYVTGVTNNGASAVDYHTIKYDMSGNVKWQHDFDYNSLMDIPFGLSILEEDSGIVITGASQGSVYDWDYQTVIYNYHGNVLEHPRASGSAAGFDRALAVKADGDGNIYITGTTFENNSNFDIKTVKLDKTGTLLWVKTIDYGNDDIANDILVNDSGEVYLCGVSHIMSDDFFLIKLDGATGDFVWDAFIDGNGENDTARKMCFDSHGNIIVTGQSYNHDNGSQDFLTAGYLSDGTKLWQDYFDPSDHESDNATGITSDVNGNIFVTGSISNKYETATIKYRTDYFTEPPQIDTLSVANLFYPNSGQLVDVNDSTVTDSVHYYTLHHYPQLYFGYGTMNMVWSRVDQDTSTTDTLQRVDVTFLNSSYRPPAFPIDEQAESGYLNYFLAQCPEGITNVYGNSSLLFGDIYTDINAVYSSNSAGLKLSFVCGTKSTPNEIGLAFAGQTGNVSIDQNWGLKVHTAIGDYVFEKPRVYQIDGSNNRVSLPWQLSWHIPASGEANFTGWGDYEEGLPLVVEVSSPPITPAYNSNLNYEWGTYFGGANMDYGSDQAIDEVGNLYICGWTYSNNFPTQSGIWLSNHGSGNLDCFISRFDLVGNPTTHSNLMWSTFYGGSGDDYAYGIDINNTNHDIYVVGNTTKITNASPTFPDIVNTSPYNQTNIDQIPSTSTTAGAKQDAFILRIENNGSTKKWITYLGGSDVDKAYDIAIDQSTNDVYVIGVTQSCSTAVYPTHIFPLVTSSSGTTPYNQTVYGGGTTSTSEGDGFITKFTEQNEMIWSTYFGGNKRDEPYSAQILTNGNLVVAGNTTSDNPQSPGGSPSAANNTSNFPVCYPSGAFFQGTYGGSFDAFLAVFNSNDELLWSTYFGGSGDDLFAYSKGLGVSSQSPKFSITGSTTTSSGFPIFPSGATSDFVQGFGSGSKAGFIASFDYDFSQTWGTYFRGAGDGLSYDSYDNLYFVGEIGQLSVQNTCIEPTNVNDFPMCDKTGYYSQTMASSSMYNYCIAAFNNNELFWSTFLGGDYSLPACASTFGNTELYLLGRDLSEPNYFITEPCTDSYWINQHTPVASPPVLFNADVVVSRFQINQQVIKVSEISNLQGLIIYPNPTNSWLNFSLPENLDNCDIEYSIYNSLGEKIYSNKIFNLVAGTDEKINFINYSPGIYTIKFNTKKNILTYCVIKI